ncbi:MAG: hypothetical protein HC836_45625 [Richelia sp. RM2_1_2]|nr:hypothetical protein [Richelia sp. RM2_1_2]
MSTGSKIDHFSITVMGDLWNVYKVSQDDNVALSEDAAAEIDLASKEIYFRANCNINEVYHEVFHLYCDYTFTDAADLDSKQKEEVCAQLFGYKGLEMIKTGNDIFKKLKDL